MSNSNPNLSQPSHHNHHTGGSYLRHPHHHHSTSAQDSRGFWNAVKLGFTIMAIIAITILMEVA